MSVSHATPKSLAIPTQARYHTKLSNSTLFVRILDIPWPTYYMKGKLSHNYEMGQGNLQDRLMIITQRISLTGLGEGGKNPLFAHKNWNIIQELVLILLMVFYQMNWKPS